MKPELRPSSLLRGEPGVQHYTLLCLAALVVILLTLYQKRFPTETALPVFLVGLLGVATRWRWGPALLLLVLGWCLVAGRPVLELLGSRRSEWFSDVFLAAAVLAFVAGHYRLQALTGSVFPPDPRRRDEARGWKLGPLRLGRRGPQVRERRAPRLAQPGEWQFLLLSLPLWPAVAQMALSWSAGGWGNPGFPAGVWRAVLLAWAGAVLTAVAAGLIDYWTRVTMTTEEATLFLQDALWHETRREQRRLNRWLAWARLRRERKEAGG
jgi:hypothetical protein